MEVLGQNLGQKWLMNPMEELVPDKHQKQRPVIITIHALQVPFNIEVSRKSIRHIIFRLLVVIDTYFDIIVIQYIHSNDDRACCLASNNNFHQRCQYPLPTEDCKNFCDQDSNCKGYVQQSSSYCQIATTSPCNHTSSGSSYNSGSTGDLGGSCGSNYGGCYIKEIPSIK